MVLTLQIVGLLFMVVIIFIAIWTFVIANNAYSQLKYQNYLLEKLVQSICTLSNSSLDSNTNTTSENYISEDIQNSNDFIIEQTRNENPKN